jgi:hypothetical protein
MHAITTFFLGLMIFSLPAHAQKAAVKEEGEGVVCVEGSRWNPAFADSRAIEAIPVPDSFRRMFGSADPCVRWSMGSDAIVDWHLRFGSVASVSAALSYLSDNRRSVPVPTAYLPLLRSAFAAAMPDLKRAAALKERPGLSYSIRYRFMQQSGKITQLNEILRTREDYVFFGRQYLHAGEEFVDPALLAQAETYISTAQAAADFLEPLESKPPVQGLLYFNLHRFETDDFRARVALLRARISGSASDLDQANLILKAIERPTDKALADLVYSGGDDFCDITDGVSDSEAISAACRADNDINQRLPNIVIDRAQYDAIMAGVEGKELNAGYGSWTSLAERLLTLEALPDHGRCCGRNVGEDRLRLLVTRAGYGERSVAGMRSTASWAEKDRRYTAWRDTLMILMQAERLAPPYTAPGRFARIARQWLNIWRAAPVMFADQGEHSDPMPDPEKQRFAAYLTAALSGLAEQSAASRLPSN